jgi:CRP/FNR family transcriptional regulator, cyclic AMP receptor protein
MDTVASRDELQVPKGAIIFRQGDKGNEMFVISEGRVRLTIGTGGQQKEVAVLGSGEFFGELSLLSDEARTATAEAVEDSTLLAIGRDVFAVLMQDDLDIVFRMMNIQGSRLRRTNQPIQELMQRMGRIRVGTCCLRHLVATLDQFPAVVDLDGLTKESGGDPEAVFDTVKELVQRGVGSLRDRKWTIVDRAQVAKLVDALSLYSQT